MVAKTLARIIFSALVSVLFLAFGVVAGITIYTIQGYVVPLSIFLKVTVAVFAATFLSLIILQHFFPARRF